MKIIQSFWSGAQTNFTNDYGWYSYKHNWLSWILSCHQLVKHYDVVELYTDNFGYDILINKLQLPYTKVHIVLNDLDIYPKDLWALAKIKTYSLQEEPFIHVDGDVYIWDKFPEEFINSNLIAQNLENTTGYYREMWNNLVENLIFIPNELLSFYNGTTNLCSNMGIVGGKDIPFFKKYCAKSLEFVNKNTHSWDKLNLFNFNIFFEQELFHELTTINSKEVTYLFDKVWDDDAYIGFGDFHLVPHKRTYLHLLGLLKRHSTVCVNLESYTMRHYPESYTKLTSLLNKTNNTNNEIDFLTTKIISDLINQFELELKKNNFNKLNFLLKRNLFNQGLPKKLECFYTNKIDFTIVSLNCFKIKSTDNSDDDMGYTKFLEVEELNSVPEIYTLDKIDLIILNELSTPVLYSAFINRMNLYFEDENEESKREFLGILNNRLINYTNLKIISIYK